MYSLPFWRKERRNRNAQYPAMKESINPVMLSRVPCAPEIL
jgi:hypothetical protein